MAKRFLTGVIGSRAGVAIATSVGALMAAAASAAIPGTDGRIHGCYNDATGDLRVIDDATETCRVSETAVSWSQSGIVGYEVVSVKMEAPAAGQVVARAQCTAGKKVLGGGYHTNNVRVIQSFPQLSGPFAPSWQVFVVNDTGASEDFTAYAVCATASP
jgi:hypothetical protein